MHSIHKLIAVTVLAAAPAAFAAEGTFHRALTVNGTADIEVQSGSGNITVRSGDVGKIEITGRVHSAYSLFGGDSQEKVDRIVKNPPIEQNGNWVRIGRIQEQWLQNNVSVSYEVVVPKDTRLKAHSGSGELRVNDIGGSTEAHTGSGGIHIHNIGGDLDARAGSGDIQAENITGNAHVNTGSGTIHLTLSGNGTAHVGAGSGNITVENAQNSLNATTGSGSIRVNGDPHGSWTIHTGSGDVTLQVPQSAKMNLYAHSSSGGVHSDLPITMNGSFERHTIHGTVNGGGPSVEIHTGSGGIEIR